jgi:Uma2 family endonuclease
VLSKSTARKDLDEKLADYEAVGSISLYALISQTRVLVSVYARDAAGGFGRFPSEQLTRIDDVIHVPDMGVQVSLADIYADTGLA